MTCRPDRLLAATGILAAALLAASTAAIADEKVSITSEAGIELTPEEKAEKDSRKACKVAICGGFRKPQAGAGDVACSVVKSWRKTQLDKMISKAKVSWPWGAVRCNADIKVSREAMSKAMSEPSYEMALDMHKVLCTVDREGKDAAEINIEFAPKVTFENGKATKAQINWGKLDAPTLLKAAMWTATATDNTFNVLEGTVVEDINDFISTKCDEVKDEWSK